MGRLCLFKFQTDKRLLDCDGTEYIPDQEFDGYHLNYYETTMSTQPFYDFTVRVNLINSYCNISISTMTPRLGWYTDLKIFSREYEKKSKF